MLSLMHDRPHVAAPEPGGAGSGAAEEQELGAALDPLWSYQAPSHLEQGILQLRQQQMMLQQQQQQQQIMLQLQQQQQVPGPAARGAHSYDSGLALMQATLADGAGGQQAGGATGASSAEGWVALQQMQVGGGEQQQQLQQQQQQQLGSRRASMMLLDFDDGDALQQG